MVPVVVELDAVVTEEYDGTDVVGTECKTVKDVDDGYSGTDVVASVVIVVSAAVAIVVEIDVSIDVVADVAVVEVVAFG